MGMFNKFMGIMEGSYDPKTGKYIASQGDDIYLGVMLVDEVDVLRKLYFKSFPNIRMGKPQPVINIDNHMFKPRCEVLVLDGDKVLVDPTNNRGGLGYSCPGGGLDPNEPIANGARRECEEEARVIPKKIVYTGVAWMLEFRTKEVAYWGSISCVCVASRGKDYKGYVKVEDRDSFVDNAIWMDINKLSEPHKIALEKFNQNYKYI